MSFLAEYTRNTSHYTDQPVLAGTTSCSFAQGSSLLWTRTLRPFYDRLIALTQEGRSLVNDVCECVRD